MEQAKLLSLANQFNQISNLIHQEFKSSTGAKKEQYAKLGVDFHKIYEKFVKEATYLTLAKKETSNKLIRIEAEMLCFLKLNLDL